MEVVYSPEDVAEADSLEQVDFIIVGACGVFLGEEPADEEVAVEEGVDEGVFDEAEGVEHVQEFFQHILVVFYASQINDFVVNEFHDKSGHGVQHGEQLDRLILGLLLTQ